MVERVQMLKCYKCWSFGHITRDCRSEIDRTGSCNKCGKNDHKARDCVNRPECPVCNKEGHRHGASNCEDYKKAVKTIKERTGIMKPKKDIQKEGTEKPEQLAVERANVLGACTLELLEDLL